MMHKPRPRWLLFSLILNIFLIGALIGGGISWWRAAAPDGGATQRRLAGDQLDPAKREAFRQVLRGVRTENRALIQQSRLGKREVALLLRAQPLDTRALDRAMARVRDADMLLRHRMEVRTIDFLAPLPIEDRRRLSAGITQRLDQRDRR
jgi:uncharacterized membrane protein